MEDLKCYRCGGTGFFLQEKGPNMGVYCDRCGGWIKWVSKKVVPSYRNKGYAIASQGQVVELKNDNPMSDLGTNKSNENLGVEIIEEQKVSNGAVHTIPAGLFGSDPDIEAEVERRVAARLKLTDGQCTPSSELRDAVDNYCSVCDGEPLTPVGSSQVVVSVFGGVLTVTNLEGTNILGAYTLKRCPECGKLF